MKKPRPIYLGPDERDLTKEPLISDFEEDEVNGPIYWFSVHKWAYGFVASNYGDVWSFNAQGGACTGSKRGSFCNIPFRIEKTDTDQGYKTVRKAYATGNRKFIKVHTLVLNGMVGECPPDKEECCHENGIRHDNRKSNLYWGTKEENLADKIRHGNILSGDNHPSKRPEERAKRSGLNNVCHRSPAAMTHIRNLNKMYDPVVRAKVSGVNAPMIKYPHLAEAIKGEGNPMAKLTRDEVIIIKRLFRDGLTSHEVVLAGVVPARITKPQSTLSLIKLGKSWKNVSAEDKLSTE